MSVKLTQEQGRGQGPGASPTARVSPLFASPGVFSSYPVRQRGAGRKSEHLPGVGCSRPFGLPLFSGGSSSACGTGTRCWAPSHT